SINALAYTTGNNIVFGHGQYQPASDSSRRLLAHELTHVVQQSGGAMTVQRQSARRINPNLVEVAHEGERYRVTRILESGRRGRRSSGSIDADIDRTNVTITIKVCRDRTRAEIELGANIPESAIGVAQRILSAVSRGSMGDIGAALEGVDVTPFLEVLLAQSGQFSLTSRGEVTVGLEGVTGGAGSLGIRIGPFDVGIRGHGDDEGWGLGGSITVTPGRTDETFECSSVPLTVRLVCQKWHEASSYEATVPVPFRDRQTRFIYFDYANATIDRSRSAQMLGEITTLLQAGYRVTHIAGHTSPEGPIQQGRRFEGNEQLGQNRANAAFAEIGSICAAQMLSMRDARRCTADVVRDVRPIGLSELYTLIAESGREVEGRPLAQHAVDQFRTSAAESSHRTEELSQQMEGMSLEQQRDAVYPLLRRATITLEKSGMRNERVTLEESAGYRSVSCPRAVEAAARLQFSF
ncbi:eCIS core domain-containing protein, partial [Parapedobacter tibetensis]|uniref:eCIS core domain-containing protein n=1 Tax=Parapedobacter tibetensis TaxID=2972951 RepID=UPI00214D37C1